MSSNYAQNSGTVAQYTSFVYGCQLSVTSNTVVNVGAGIMRDSTDAFDIPLVAALNCDLSKNGANGLDTGTIAASTFYYIFVIFDPTNANPPATLASLSATAPYLPGGAQAGYSLFRCIGVVLTDGSSHLLPFNVTGNANVRKYEWNTPIAVLTAGTASTAADVSLATAVPSANFGKVSFMTVFTPNAASDTFQIRAKASSAYSFEGIGQVASVVLRDAVDLIPTLNSGAPTITYVLSTASASLTLDVRGFEFNI